jgi:hypothetical protein
MFVKYFVPKLFEGILNTKIKKPTHRLMLKTIYEFTLSIPADQRPF